MTHFWITGLQEHSWIKGSTDNATVRYYVDGEATPGAHTPASSQPVHAHFACVPLSSLFPSALSRCPRASHPISVAHSQHRTETCARTPLTVYGAPLP